MDDFAKGFFDMAIGDDRFSSIAMCQSSVYSKKTE